MAVRHPLLTRKNLEKEGGGSNRFEDAEPENVGSKQERNPETKKALFDVDARGSLAKGKGCAHARYHEQCCEAPLMHDPDDEEQREVEHLHAAVFALKFTKGKSSVMKPDKQGKQNDSEPVYVVTSHALSPAMAIGE